jgi:hypothetical protein
MAIVQWLDSYGIEPESFEFSLRFNTLVGAASALDGSISAIALPGARWSAKFSYPYATEKNADLIEACLATLEGQANQVYLSHPRKRRSRGSMGDGVQNPSLLAASANQGDAQVSIVCLPFKTAKAGDLFQCNDRLHRLTSDAAADAGGIMILKFMPRLPAALPSGVDVIFDRPQGLFIAQQPETPLTYRNQGIEPFSISFVGAR